MTVCGVYVLSAQAMYDLSAEGEKAREKVQGLRDMEESELKISNVIRGELNRALEKEADMATVRSAACLLCVLWHC